MAWALWVLGYPDQAVERIHEALPMAQVLSHPFTLAATLMIAAIVNLFCRDVDTVQAQAAAAIALSTEHGFPYWSSVGEILQGWVQAEQGQGKEGMAQMYQGMAAWRATGAEFLQPYFVAPLAEAYKKAEQAEAGLTLLAPRHWLLCTKMGSVCGRRSCIGSRGSCCCSRLQGEAVRDRPLPKRWKPAFVRPSTWPASSRQSRWSYGPR
jgi:hypothetical protein